MRYSILCDQVSQETAPPSRDCHHFIFLVIIRDPFPEANRFGLLPPIFVVQFLVSCSGKLDSFISTHTTPSASPSQDTNTNTLLNLLLLLAFCLAGFSIFYLLSSGFNLISFHALTSLVLFSNFISRKRKRNLVLFVHHRDPIRFYFSADCLELVSMGICLSARIKVESSMNTGVSSKYVSTDGSGSSSSSKISSVSVPSTPRSEGEILQSPNLKSFNYAELKLSTRNFRPDTVLGEGGFGSVYKGWIDENSYTAAKAGTGLLVAVKRLNVESLQGHREWLAEVNYLGQLHHPHLVKLLGYCLEDEHRLLVYEFMPRGSLENHLFRRGSYFQPLSWSLRLKVAIGAAKGLAFLHSAETRVIYRDFKTSNILLDLNYNAKLSDFGLAKDGPTGDKSHVSTRVMGTYGYAAPEYLATGHLTARSDVYSFGVVLVEMLSGRRAVDTNRPSGEHNLVEWARPYLGSKRRIYKVLDSRLQGQYAMEAAYRAANLALRCISTESKLRPTMEGVVTELEQLRDLKHIRTTKSTNEVNHRTPDVAAKRTVSYPRPSALYA